MQEDRTLGASSGLHVISPGKRMENSGKEQSREKRFWGKKRGLSQNKKSVRTNRKLWHRKEG